MRSTHTFHVVSSIRLPFLPISSHKLPWQWVRHKASLGDRLSLVSLTEPDLQAQDVKTAEFTAAATRSAAMLSGAAVQERLVPPGELAVLRGDSDRQSRGTCEKLRQNCLKKGGPTRTCQFLQDRRVWNVPMPAYDVTRMFCSLWLFLKSSTAVDLQKSTREFFLLVL